MKKLKFKQDNNIEGVCIVFNQEESKKIMELKKILDFYIFKLKVRTLSGNYVYINYIDIYYFEVVDGRCYVNGENEIYQGVISFKQLKDKLVGNGFLQCNKTQVINESHLEDLEMEKDCQRVAKLDNGDMVLVSRKYKNEVDNFKHPHRIPKII